jgi:hypothetical protein
MTVVIRATAPVTALALATAAPARAQTPLARFARTTGSIPHTGTAATPRSNRRASDSCDPPSTATVSPARAPAGATTFQLRLRARLP